MDTKETEHGDEGEPAGLVGWCGGGRWSGVIRGDAVLTGPLLVFELTRVADLPSREHGVSILFRCIFI